MANLSKIKVGNISYDIVPQLGTALVAEDGVVSLKMGSGIACNDSKELVVNIGTGLNLDDKAGRLYVSLGTAVAEGNDKADTGIAVRDGVFSINPTAFKSYLQSLGVNFNQ